MAAFRQDIAQLDTWHADVEWYSRAVGALMGLPITNRRSWRYMAAIHGIDLDPGGWRARGLIQDDEALPAQAEQNEMWDQCQHAGWYFLPWHRGYLSAFESIVAWAIVQLGGAAEWKLPYWNYFDISNVNALRIPQAFTEPCLPDGRSNALSWWARSSTLLLNASLTGENITLDAMKLHAFTAEIGGGALGGSPTGFAQFGSSSSAGVLELDPHNKVHVMVGGLGGLMTDPNYAALDPLFWLHHCNIDRLWSAWLASDKNTQESSAAWADGPTPRQFRMQRPDGTLETFKPADCLPGGRLEPKYDDLRIGTGMAAPGAGLAPIVAHPPIPANLSSYPPPKPRLLGSNEEILTVGATRSAITVQLAGNALASPAAGAGLPQRYFVVLEGIRGLSPSSALSVYLAPAAPSATQTAPVFAKTVTLFGLSKASMSAESAHAGGGLGVSVDVTDAVHQIASQGSSQLDKLHVLVELPAAMRLGKLTIEKVSIFSQASLLALEGTWPSPLGVTLDTRQAMVCGRCRGGLRTGDAQPESGPCHVVRLRAARGGPPQCRALACMGIRGKLVRHAARDDAALTHRARAASVARQPALVAWACAALLRGWLRCPVDASRTAADCACMVGRQRPSTTRRSGAGPGRRAHVEFDAACAARAQLLSPLRARPRRRLAGRPGLLSQRHDAGRSVLLGVLAMDARALARRYVACCCHARTDDVATGRPPPSAAQGCVASAAGAGPPACCDR